MRGYKYIMIVENEKEIYGRVYDIAQSYMQKEKESILFSKKVFLESIGHRANEIDMKEWSTLEGIDFINCAYLELLRRFPSQSDILFWLQQSDYKRKLINTIICSYEFSLLNIEILNNPYPVSKLKSGIYNRLFKETSDELRQCWYFRLYMKFPKKVRKLIKKIIFRF